MAFCKFGKDYIKNGYTEIENSFLYGHMPQADATDVKVYLYGLYAAGLGVEQDNSVEKIAISLKLSKERVLSAFRYWEEQGIVTLSRTHPPEVTYRSVKAPLTPVVKLNAREYSVFVEEMARIFPDKILGENELLSYIELMKRFRMETNAMLLIARYCVDAKGGGTPYILAVASDWAKQGVITEAAVNERIEELERNGEDLRAVFQALGLRSAPSVDDRQLLLKWTKDYGYKQDAVLTACRMLKKKGGMERLSRLIDELHAAGALTAVEVDAYGKAKTFNIDLASKIVSALGGWYSSLDAAVETYVLPWLSKGFEPEALLTIARYCFKRSIKTLEGMDAAAEKFYKLGLITVDAIEGYAEKQFALDKSIREIFFAAETDAAVSRKDRDFYRTFIEDWGFSHEAVVLVAGGFKRRPFLMSDISRTLAALKQNKIFDTERIKAFLSSGEGKSGSGKTPPAIPQNYTQEQLDSLFHSLDGINVEDEEI